MNCVLSWSSHPKGINERPANQDGQEFEKKKKQKQKFFLAETAGKENRNMTLIVSYFRHHASIKSFWRICII